MVWIALVTEFRFRNPQTNKLDGGFVPVDFAMNATSYGCKTYKVTTEEELYAALADAKKQNVSTLIDISTTQNHDSWLWQLGTSA